jgi:hypothetical protein
MIDPRKICCKVPQATPRHGSYFTDSQSISNSKAVSPKFQQRRLVSPSISATKAHVSIHMIKVEPAIPKASF